MVSVCIFVAAINLAAVGILNELAIVLSQVLNGEDVFIWFWLSLRGHPGSMASGSGISGLLFSFCLGVVRTASSVQRSLLPILTGHLVLVVFPVQ